MAKGGKAGQVALWILLALLIVGLAGFGIGGFGGSIRSIGSVGDQEIGTNDYARALRQEMNAIVAQTGRPLSMQQALAFGLDRSVRQQLVTTAALDDLAAQAGLSVGDARLAAEIRAMSAFGGTAGAFDRDTYRFMLEQNGFSEATFEARVRADLARALIQRAVATGPDAPEALGAAFYAYVAERRDITLVRLGADDLVEPLPEPTDADLRAHHAANEAAYTRPAGRRITYAALLPEMLIDEVPVDEATLRAAYDQRINEFVQPERRLVERLVFPDEAAAEDARNRVDAGTSAFEDIVAERGLTLDDIDLGDVALADLGAAGAAVFAAEAPAVLGPLPSPLGPALFRVNAVLAAQEVTFDEARADLMAEFAMDGARRIVDDRIEAIEDLLAGGATLEDLGAEAGLQVGTIELFPGDSDGMAGYPAFRERAQAATAADFPEVFQLSDGGIAALRLDAEVPAALIPFEEVAGLVAEDWRAAALRTALADRAVAAEEALRAGGETTIGTAETIAGLTRDGFIEGAPAAVLTRAFEMNEGGVARIETEGFTGIVRVDAIAAADQDAPEAVLLKGAFAAQAGQSMAEDAFALFARAVEARAEIRLDEGAIAAVHSQMQ